MFFALFHTHHPSSIVTYKSNDTCADQGFIISSLGWVNIRDDNRTANKNNLKVLYTGEGGLVMFYKTQLGLDKIWFSF